MRKNIIWGMVGIIIAVTTASPVLARREMVQDRDGQTILEYENSYALIIGISRYKHWPGLPGVERDVPEVKAALERVGFQVQVAENLNTRDDLDQAFRSFIKAYGRDPAKHGKNRLVFYFAGHGETLKLSADEEYGTGYLVGADAPIPKKDANHALLEERGFYDYALEMGAIKSYAETSIHARHALFVFDSCFAGSIFTIERAVPEDISEKTAHPVRQFITAGTADEKVLDKSVFRQQFVAALRGDGDADRDGYVTGGELGLFLEKHVAPNTDGRQHPQYGKISKPSLAKGDFVFKLPGTAPTPTPEAATPVPTPRIEQPPDLTVLQQWQTYQQNVEAYFQQIDQLVRQPGATAPMAIDAWGQFLAYASQDNPYSTEDDRLRQTAQRQLASLKIEPTAAPAATAPPQEEQEWTEPKTGMKFVWIPGDCFQMGSPDTEDGRDSDEGPVHEVCLDGFWLGKYEVTQAQWQKIMGENPSSFTGSKRPVENVSWNDVQDFIQRLNSGSEGTLRLPSEAEWEYACRAGTTTPFSFGDTISADQANYDGNYTYGNGKKGVFREQTTDVGSFPPNAFGLHDMHGNVWEWCANTYHDSYDGAPNDGTLWGRLDDVKAKVLRGGSWSYDPDYCRSAYRYRLVSDIRSYNVGVRVVAVFSRTP